MINAGTYLILAYVAGATIANFSLARTSTSRRSRRPASSPSTAAPSSARASGSSGTTRTPRRSSWGTSVRSRSGAGSGCSRLHEERAPQRPARRHLLRRGGERHHAGRELQAHRQARLLDGADPPPLREEGVGGAEDHRALLDHLDPARARVPRVDEAPVRPMIHRCARQDGDRDRARASGVAAARAAASRAARVVRERRRRRSWSLPAHALEADGASLAPGGHHTERTSQRGPRRRLAGRAAVRRARRLRGDGPRGHRRDGARVPLRRERRRLIGGTNGKSTTTALTGEMFEGSEEAPSSAATSVRRSRPSSDRAVGRARARDLELPGRARAHAARPIATRCSTSPTTTSTATSFDGYVARQGQPVRADMTRSDVAVCPRATRSVSARRVRPRRACHLRRRGWAVRRARRDLITRPPLGDSRTRSPSCGIKGRHNVENACASIPHRSWPRLPGGRDRRGLALVHRASGTAWRSRAELGGVRYYDDSKGTNVGATVAALTGSRSRGRRADRRRRRQGRQLLPARRARCAARGRALVLIGEAATPASRGRVALAPDRRRVRRPGRGRPASRALRRARRATPCCSRRRARASTCSVTTSTAATSSKAP
jgi:UDP-N-acetylmuramoylalanine--D-glutamate ligase